LVFYPVAQCSLCGPQTHELANQCICLHLVPVELPLCIFQYHLRYQRCLRFTWVAPFYPIGVRWFLCIILGFFIFFPMRSLSSWFLSWFFFGPDPHMLITGSLKLPLGGPFPLSTTTFLYEGVPLPPPLVTMLCSVVSTTIKP